MKPRRPTIRDVRQAAAGRWLQVLVSLAPELADAAKTVGSTRHHVCPKHGGDNGDAFRFYEDAEQTGGAVCNSCGSLASGFDVLTWLLGWTLNEAVERVAEAVGLEGKPLIGAGVTGRPRGRPPKDPGHHGHHGAGKPLNGHAHPSGDPVSAAVASPAQQARAAEVSAARAKMAQRWQQGIPDPGRIAAYLHHRGLSIPVPPSLRFIGELTYYHDAGDGSLAPAGEFPAIVAMVQHPSLGLVALHRTYLDAAPSSHGKADVPSPKKLSTPIYQGATHGAAIRLFPEGETLAVTEGIETALAVREATGLPVWAAVSANGLAAVELPPPPRVRRVELWCDHDVSGVGQQAAADAAQRLSAQGFEVVILTPPRPGTDWLDEFRDHGADALLAAQRDAAPFVPAAGNLPEILVRTAEHEVIDEAIRALESEPAIYTRGGGLVHVVRDSTPAGAVARPPNAPRIAQLPFARLRELLAKNARFVKAPRGGDGDPYPVHPPVWAVQGVEARGHWPGFRRIENVVECPVLLPDGSILETPGYDPQTGLLYEPCGEFLPVPPAPTREDARQAVAELYDLVTDFPFATPAHRSTWLAGLLTPLARFAFHGPSPLFLVDANVRGAGKGKLIDVIARVVSGREMSRAPYSDKQEEVRKAITAIALSGDLLVLLDNIGGMLGDPALDAALTATTWNDRVLGKSERTGELPMQATWFASGNNIVLRADTARRVAHIRLDSPLENPEERGGFRYPDLMRHVKEARPRAVQAALTILRGFFLAGRPDQRLRPWGSFEGWSSVVRESLVWAGEPDPGDTRTELAREADSEAVTLRNLIAGWEAFDTLGQGVSTNEVMRAIDEPVPADFPDPYEALRVAITDLCGGRRGGPNALSLGRRLSSLRGRVAGGKAMTYRTGRAGVKYWYVESRQNSSPSQPSSPAGRVNGDDGSFGEASTTPLYTRGKYELDNIYRGVTQPSPNDPSSPGGNPVDSPSAVVGDSLNAMPDAAPPAVPPGHVSEEI